MVWLAQDALYFFDPIIFRDQKERICTVGSSKLKVMATHQLPVTTLGHRNGHGDVQAVIAQGFQQGVPVAAQQGADTCHDGGGGSDGTWRCSWRSPQGIQIIMILID